MKTLVHFIPLAVVGGCEVNCLRIIKGVNDYCHRVVVFDDVGPMSAEWEAAGAEVTHLNAWMSGIAHFQNALVRWMDSRTEPDGVFYWSSSRLPVVLGALRKWDAPVVVHLGNPLSEAKIAIEVRRWWQEQCHVVRPGTVLAACSEQVALSHRRAHFFRQYPIEVVYNPVEVSMVVARDYRALPIGSRPLIGMVGRLDVIKDQISIIRAVADLANVRTDIVVEFAGDGDLRLVLEEEARRLGVAERVRFLGFVQVRSRLAAWDIYVHATTQAEGMGTAVAEAMMEERPCVVSDLPVMREVCGEAADYFPAGDASGLARVLQALVADRERRYALGRAARLRAEAMFAMSKVADAYMGLLAGGVVKEVV